MKQNVTANETVHHLTSSVLVHAHDKFDVYMFLKSRDIRDDMEAVGVRYCVLGGTVAALDVATAFLNKAHRLVGADQLVIFMAEHHGASETNLVSTAQFAMRLQQALEQVREPVSEAQKA